MGAAALPLILTAASAGAEMYNNQQVARNQQEEMTRSLTKQSIRQGEADQAVSEALRERAVSSADQDRQDAGSQYLDQVRAAQANATKGLGQVGAVSNAYQQSANDAALGVGDYAAKTADLMARIDAPVMQRQREDASANRLGTALSLVRRNAAGDDYLARLRLARIQPNAALTAASRVAGAAAGAYGGGGGLGGAAQGGISQFGSEAGSWFSDPSLWRTS